MTKHDSPHPMIPVPQAIRIVLQQAAKFKPTTASLTPQVGLVLDQDVIMPSPGYPRYPASIMDGFAVLQPESSYKIIDRIHAQHTEIPKLEPNQAIYVTTGAPVPPNAIVIPIEDCMMIDNNETTLTLKETADLKKQWIRPVGCDIPPDTVVLPKGRRLEPCDLGLLAQTRIETVSVRQLTVGVLSTGTEVFQGNIPDANRPALLAILREFVTVTDLGTVPDDETIITETLRKALDSCDIIITTGGISMGEADLLEQVIVRNLGAKLHFGRIHMKPGKPTTFCTLGKHKMIFAMPGNPVSAIVCTHLLVRPCIERILTDSDRVHAEIQVTLTQDLSLDPERPEYHRIGLEYNLDGTARAVSTGVQRSSRLMSMRDAQALLILPQGKGSAKAGGKYTSLLLDSSRSIDIKDSVHLKEERTFTVRVISKSPVDERMISDALTGSKSGRVEVSSQLYDRDDEILGLVSSCQDDIVLVTAPSMNRFADNVQVSNALRQKLEKLADGIAMQVRSGSASQNPVCAIFETVVGFTSTSLVVWLPEEGLQSGLAQVRGLIKHAVEIFRGSSVPH